MSIALRYAKDKQEGQEVLNDSFVKVFKKINQFDERQSFKGWFRTIIIHTAIDYHRKSNHFKNMQNIEENQGGFYDSNMGWDNLLYDDVVEQIQLLPAAYRTVFNLYAIEGYKHHEIAQKLNISIGSSKSNFSRARKKLQLALKSNYTKQYLKHGK